MVARTVRTVIAATTSGPRVSLSWGTASMHIDRVLAMAARNGQVIRRSGRR